MDPRITQVTEYLDKVATKLGLGASEIWPWLIKQQYIEPLMYLVFVPFAGFASWWLFKQIDVANKKAEDGEWTSTEAKNTKETAVITGVIILAVASVLFALGTIEALECLNVEYAALKDLLKMVK